MKPRYQASKAAIEMIKRFEGCRHRAARLPDGAWTIGYGHTRTAREGVEISDADADALLIYDIAAVVKAINEWVYSPLTQNQFDALVAFVFNIGSSNFRRSSVLRRLNEGSYLQAACAMEMWRTADFEGERIVIDALVRRRSAEMALFLQPQDGFVPVPSLIIVPRVDEQVAGLAPTHIAEVETPLKGPLTEAYRTDEPMPSAGRAAAEAVATHLASLVQEPDEPFATEASAPTPRPLPIEDEALSAEEPEFEVNEPSFDAERVAESLADVQFETVSDAAEEPRPIVFVMPQRPLGAPKRKKGRAPGSVLALMGLIGLAVFVAGIFWGFNARAAARVTILPDPVMTGWVLGLVGVALAATSIYLLLNRLGAKGD
jgi:lysozyme